MPPDDPIMALLAQLLAAQPQMDKYGNTQPYDLGYQKDAANFYQDQSQILGDPMMMAMAGIGGVDPYAFEPVQDGFDTYDLPTRPLMDAYLQSDPSSLEFNIASAIDQRKTPGQIMATLKESGAWDPGDMDSEKMWRDTVNQLFQENAQYSTSLAQVPKDENGQPMTQVPRYKDSEATAVFKKLGLPTPTQQWGASDFGGDPNYDQNVSALAERFSQADQGFNDARQIFDRQSRSAGAGVSDSVVPQMRMSQLPAPQSNAERQFGQTATVSGQAVPADQYVDPFGLPLGGSGMGMGPSLTPPADPAQGDFGTGNDRQMVNVFNRAREAAVGPMLPAARAGRRSEPTPNRNNVNAYRRGRQTAFGDLLTAQGQQARAQGSADEMGRQGRTPLREALLQRVMAMRAMGL